jgi:hypothetical protein
MFTFYTDRFVSPTARGTTRGFLIFIRPQYKDDRGLLEHEKVHRKQFFKHGLFIHSLLYKFVPEYRIASEVEAFREQARWYEDDRLPHFAKIIATRYGLNVTEEAALKLLRDL